MLSIFIPCIFKFKSKSETSIKICTKVILKDYSILLLIILSIYGINKFLQHLDIQPEIINILWISSSLDMVCYFCLSMIILKSKYYIHNFISLIFFCIFSVTIDLIFGNLLI